MKKIHIQFLALLLVVIHTSACERQSGRRNGLSHPQDLRIDQPQAISNGANKAVVIPMTLKNGVYYIPCRINGINMNFIFDTGASDITISLTEALFLYKQGTLSDDDFIGTQQYQIANGDVEEGTIVLINTVEIGNRMLHNVQASIVHNMEAPLLLGQSALSKFGKISIDYNNNEITFK